MDNLFKIFHDFSNCVQTHLSSFGKSGDSSSTKTHEPVVYVSQSSSSQKKVLPNPLASASDWPEVGHVQKKDAAPSAKDELGRATWIFLHTLAAQYPDNPTRQQKKDVKELMAIISRMYPCKECADHFKEILRANPVLAGSHSEFSQWLCHVHNVVNRSLGKTVFPCARVDGRWGKLECEQRACDLLGETTEFGYK